MTPSLYLVSCVSQKATEPCAARDLYQSDWFRKARAYVEALRAPWRILSAEHGVVHPDQTIGPYDRTLATMPAHQRQLWAHWVSRQLSQFTFPPNVVFLAGENYRHPDLMQWLRATRGAAVDVPMAGLGIGQQKAWLLAKTEEARRVAR